MQHVLQYRKESEDLVWDMAQLTGERCKTGFEVLEYSEPSEDLPALRYQRQPGSGALVRRQIVQNLAFPSNAAGADRLQPEDCPQEARLADAVAAEDAGHLALFRVQADAAQRMARAVIEIDRLDGQHSLQRPR